MRSFEKKWKLYKQKNNRKNHTFMEKKFETSINIFDITDTPLRVPKLRLMEAETIILPQMSLLSS